MVFLQFLYRVFSILSLFSVLLMKKSVLVFAGPTGLTLKLIHIDSPESPLYPGNLTQEERMERDFKRSEARHQQLMASIKSWQVRNSTNSISPDMVRPPVSYEGIYYMTLLGIGSFPDPSHYTFKNYYFVFDTGSALLWLQCRGCSPCYAQVGDAYYPATDSDTYHEIPCNSGHPLCKAGLCRGNVCSYDIKYGDGCHTKGVLATERLVLNEDHGGLEVINDYVFGCGLEQEKFDLSGGGRKTEIAGVLGLGGGAQSFLRQLGVRGQMRFAYCLELWTHNKASSTFLRFGSDADIGAGQVVQTTPMYFGRGPNVYFVDLDDISVGGTRMEYKRADFGLKSGGRGGCIFDTGTPWTLMARKVYDPLRAYMIQYFTALDVPTLDRRVPKYDLCFTRPNGFNSFPSITFHFNEADLEVEPEAAFYMKNDVFCFAFLPMNDASVSVIVGGIQMANYRILHDLTTMKISWVKEECSLNS